MKHLWRARCAFVLALATLLARLACLAQTLPPTATQPTATQPIATLALVVADPSGAAIPNAAVHLEPQPPAVAPLQDDTQQLDHNRLQEARTRGDGRLSLTLPAGDYTLTVTSPGFNAYRHALHLAPGQPTRLTATLAIATVVEQIAVPADPAASTAAADNASALVFSRDQLSTFSDDDATFQKELLALAGGDGSRPPQVYINGFSGGRFPSKSSILSVHINKNPYSAVYDSLGFGRVEIDTKPGGEKLHGQFNVNATDNVLNAQNPYISTLEPPYYLLNLDGNLSGSFNRKTSFFLSGVFNDQQNNAALNAVTLNTASQQVPYAAAVRDPQLTSTFGLRLDRQLTANNSLFGRYEFNQVTLTNGGLTSPLTLATQAFNSGITTQTLQLGDTQIFSPHLLAEHRFQYVRTRQQQDAISSAPTLLIEGGFNGGGNAAQSLHDDQDRFEFQDTVSIDHGAHYLRLGARYRLQRDANLSSANYNGQWTFPSLAAFAASQPSQFSLTTGQPSASLVTGDLSAYAEDEWKVARSVTLDLGFRLESQSAIPDHFDPAPRIGVAWALHRKGRKATFLTLRSGGGIFYDRFAATNLLTAIRQNGIRQQTYLLNNPTTYPQLPSPASLSATPPAIYRVSPTLKSQYGLAGGLSAEKNFGKLGTASVNYVAVRGVHQWGSLNINAPLPGTYNPAVPNSGTRPLGGSQNIDQFDSEGISKTQVVFFNSRLNLGKRASAFLSYSIVHGNQDVANATIFASNSYNLSQDYGRAAQPSQQLFVGGTVKLPFGIDANLFASTQGGTPFNITTGTDLNGDSQYNDRPAFATAPTASSQIYTTRFGAFDANPQPGEKIVPINYGNSPNFAFLDLSASRSFQLGRRPAAPAAVAGKPAAGKPAPPRPDPPFTLTFTVDVPNVLNHRNPGLPIGVLSSPLFGQSVSLNSPFSPNTAANRVIFFQSSFSF